MAGKPAQQAYRKFVKHIVMTKIRNIAIVLLASLLQQCSYSQSNTAQSNTDKMENNSKKHPLYSRTDTAKVDISDKEWQKILPRDIYNIAREKGTERP